jgi:hypothetical protein
MRCASGSGAADSNRVRGAILNVFAMAASTRVMVSYPVECEHGGVGLDKEIDLKEDGRYIIYYTFEDEED